MPKPIDIAGQRFGRLVALERRIGKFPQAYWLCRCDCGNEGVYRQIYLRRGTTKSCGCYREDARRTHNGYGTTLHRRWGAMRQRCSNPNNKRYADYGGRGIYCVPEWDDFGAFSEWARESGFRPELQIDRIDNDGPYSPDNCRWVDAKTNMANRRNSRSRA